MKTRILITLNLIFPIDASINDLQETDPSVDAKNNMTLNNPNKDAGNMLIHNPYYEGSDEVSGQLTKKSSIIPELNNTEIITKIQNAYYQM